MSQICDIFSTSRCWCCGALNAAGVGEVPRGGEAPEGVAISVVLDISAAVLALGWILSARSHLDVAIGSGEIRVATSNLVFGHILARYMFPFTK